MLFKIITFILLLPSFLLAQHSIKGVFLPAKNYKTVLLYKVTPTLSEYIANSKIQNDGSFLFQLDAAAKPGIYRIVYAIPQENFNFDVIYNGKEDVVLEFNSETGVSFKSSFENNLLASYTSSMLAITKRINAYYRENKKNTVLLKTIFKTQNETQNRYEKQAKNTIAWHFIKASKPYIPKKHEDVKTYVENVKTHYFDHIDFNNKILQSSSFLQERMLNYVFGITSENKDYIANFKNNIEVFCNTIQNTPDKVKSNLLTDLWQEMVDLNLSTVANYLSNRYLIDVAKRLKNTKLVETLTLYSSLSVGQIAPDFSFVVEKNKVLETKKLSDLNNAETYIIVFWSSTCSHCLNQIPLLYKFLKLQNTDTKVIAIGLEETSKNWNEIIKNYPEFTHVLGLGKWENSIAKKYGINATPTFFILNKNKKIIDKPQTLEKLKTFFSK